MLSKNLIFGSFCLLIGSQSIAQNPNPKDPLLVRQELANSYEVFERIQCSFSDAEGNSSVDLDYFLVGKNRKFGILENTGKVALALKYDKIIWEDNDDAIARGFINGKVQLFQLGTHKIQASKNLYESAIPSEIGLGLIVQKNGLKGAIPFGTTQEAIPCKYETIDIWDLYAKNKELKALVKKNGKWGILTKNNHELLPCQYDTLLVSLDFNFEKGFMLGKKGNSYDVFNHKIQFLSKIEAVQIIDIESGFLICKKANQYGVLSPNNKQILPFEYDELVFAHPERGHFYAKKNQAWGMVDSNNRVLLKFEYQLHRTFVKAKTVLYASETNTMSASLTTMDDFWINELRSLSGKRGLLDIVKAQFAIPAEYDTVGTSSKSALKNGKWGQFNNRYQQIIPFEYDSIHLLNPSDFAPSDGFVPLYLADKYLSDYDYFRVFLNNKQGIYDPFGKQLLAADYEQVTPIFTGDFRPQIGYFRVQKNGKIGILSPNGKTELIPFRYDSIRPAPAIIPQYEHEQPQPESPQNPNNPSEAPAQYFFAYHGDKVDFYRTAYQEIAPEPNSEADPYMSILFKPIGLDYQGFQPTENHHLYFSKKDNKYGIFSAQALEILAPTYDTIFRDATFGGLNRDLIFVKKNSLYGLITPKGGEILPCIYDTIALTFLENTQLYLLCKKGNDWSFLDKNGKKWLQQTYEEGFQQVWGSNGAFWFVCAKNGKKGIIDGIGNLKAPFEYEEIRQDEDRNRGFYVCKNGKWGIFGLNLNPLVACEHERIAAANAGLWKIRKNGKWGLFSADASTQIIAPVYDSLLHLSNGDFYLLAKQNQLYGLFDYAGKQLLTTDYQAISGLNAAFFRLKKNNQYSLSRVDSILQPLAGSQADSIWESGLWESGNYFFQMQGKCGLIFAHSNPIQISVPALYDAIHYLNPPFNSHLKNKPYLCVYKNGQKGVIDTQNRNILDFGDYEHINDYAFVNGDLVFAVSKKGKYGLVNRQREALTDFKYPPLFAADEAFKSMNKSGYLSDKGTLFYSYPENIWQVKGEFQAD